MVTLYLPIIFVIGQAPIKIIFREYLGEGFGNALSIASFSFVPIYGSFLMAWSMLYERTRRSFGEPSSDLVLRAVSTAARVGQRIRLGTRVWATAAAAMILGVLLPPFLGWNETFGNNLGSAVLEGRLKDAEAFLSKGHATSEGRGPNRNPIRQAVENGDIPMAQLLLSHGATIESAPDTNSPLHYAVLRHHPAMVSFLLEHGAKTEVYDNTHDTPLSLAAKNGQMEAARLLLKSGADRSTKDVDGKTPLDHAREQGHADLARLLEAK